MDSKFNLNLLNLFVMYVKVREKFTKEELILCGTIRYLVQTVMQQVGLILLNVIYTDEFIYLI